MQGWGPLWEKVQKRRKLREEPWLSVQPTGRVRDGLLEGTLCWKIKLFGFSVLKKNSILCVRLCWDALSDLALNLGV